MPPYILEDKKEVTRLEEQSQLKNYSLLKEIGNCDQCLDGQKVLDAGCGSAVISKYLIKANPEANFSIDACDFSDLQIQQAKKTFSQEEKNRINIFQANLEKIPIPSNYYDKIYCRYVFQHLPSPDKAMRELSRVLAPNGILVVVDIDGLLSYIDLENDELKNMLQIIQNNPPVHFNIGRTLKRHMLNAGLKHVDFNTETMHFKSRKDKREEAIQFKQRLSQAFPFLVKILGTKKKASRFKELFIKEIQKETSLLYYEKFIVTGYKES